MTASVDQEPDSIAPDTQCNDCNKLEAPCCESEVVNNPESQTDFNIVVPSCILCSNKGTKFMIQFTNCNSWLHYYCTNLPHQVQMYSATQIHAVCKNFSETDILKTENEELLMEQLKTVKDENKQESNR